MIQVILKDKQDRVVGLKLMGPRAVKACLM